MKIRLFLKETRAGLELNDEESIIDKKQWIDENNLLERFFPILDELLKRNNCVIDDIDDFVLDTNVPNGYTTARIARTIIKTLSFAQKK